MNFGNGIVTAPTGIDIVTSSSPDLLTYLAPDGGAYGILGIGPNNGFPGTSSLVTALPGLLNNGVLINETQGTLTFGPNPLPSHVAVSGAPTSTVDVQINNGPMQTVPVAIDSGGVYGSIPSSVLGTGQTSGNVPAGTMISVYTPDGQTLLYSYTTTASNSPLVTDGGTMNTGYMPFQQQPVYVSYDPSGFGTTVFDT